MPTPESRSETTFLRHVIAYDVSTTRHELDCRIAQAQRDARCVRRAVLVMALLTALALVSLAYAAVLFPHHPLDLSRFFTHPLVRLLLALGLAATVSALWFLALDVVYRKRLDARREECRQFAAKVIEARLGEPTVRLARMSMEENEGQESSRTTEDAHEGGLEARSRSVLASGFNASAPGV